MKLSEMLAEVETGFKAVEHAAVIGLHKLRVADDSLTSVATMVLPFIPSMAPAVTVAAAQKAALDAADDFVQSQGAAAPAALVQAIENLKGAIAKSKPAS